MQVKQNTTLRRSGHCELFASAGAIALRRLGYSSRYVTGFVCAERNPYRKDLYLARNRHAHALVEAYDPDRGWRKVELTPGNGQPDVAPTGGWDAFADWASGVGQQLWDLLRDGPAGLPRRLISLVADLAWWIVTTPEALAAAAVHSLPGGSKVFAGQRDDPFFVDLGSTFDLLSIRPAAPGNRGGGRDDLAGFNVLSIALQVPITQLTNDARTPTADGLFAVIGSWTTAYRQQTRVQRLTRSARLLGTRTAPEAALEIARRARGTPRIANRLLRRAWDFAVVGDRPEIDLDIARHALDRMKVDALGLDDMDRKLLRVMIDHYDGGPVGVENLAIAVSEELDTVTDVVGPFLIQAGFLARTPRGRTATPKAYAHLGLKAPRRALDLL
jgi:hypothetical protein